MLALRRSDRAVERQVGTVLVVSGSVEQVTMASAEAIVRDSIVWDQLFPVTETCGTFFQHVDTLETMRTAGYTAVSLSMAYDPEDTVAAIRRISAWRSHIDAEPERYLLIRDGNDVRRAKNEGKLAIGLHFQGSTPFGRDVGLVPLFYDLGIRQAILAYNTRNAVGGGCHEDDPGLSRFGRALVAEMNKVGMWVDASHTGSRTALDAMELGPVIYSHANASAVHNHPRNINDDLANAAVQSGGVVGVNGVGWFLGTNDKVDEALFAHIDHWTALLGPENVSLGLDVVTDIPGTLAAIRRESGKWPAELGYQADHLTCCEPNAVLALTERMLQAGYDESACRGILGENWLRLADRTWRRKQEEGPGE